MNIFVFSSGILIVILFLFGIRKFYQRRKEIMEDRKNLKEKKNEYRTNEELINYSNDWIITSTLIQGVPIYA